MAGVYIHIPYCRQVCYYCDFHFSVSLKKKDQLLESLKQEMELRKAQWNQETFTTLYIGGGTPSLLTLSELDDLINALFRYYRIAGLQEFTLEVNPDDLSMAYLKGLEKLGINRLSIGVQSFFDAHLNWMNRRHTAAVAKESIENAKSCGFGNLNMDLIYGIPQMSLKQWEENLSRFLAFGIPHLSAYHLTIEPKTVFAHFVKKGKLTPITEEESIRQFELVLEMMDAKGYDHYEISNFARPGYAGIHNTRYWQGEQYLGLGPSAHSFNWHARQWNPSNTALYIEKLNKGELPVQEEVLTPDDRFNDYLLTRLRTKWGINLQYIQDNFGLKYVHTLQPELLKKHSEGLVFRNEQSWVLTTRGKMMADKIISDLIYIQ